MVCGAEALCGGGDAGERRTQVALDVDAERLDRRDIHDAAALGLGGDGREHQAIDRAEEGGEGLAGAGGGEQQGGGAAGDRGPAEHLRGGGGLEAGGEPRARGRVQEGQRIDGGGADGCRCTGHRGGDYRRDAAIGHCEGRDVAQDRKAAGACRCPGALRGLRRRRTVDMRCAGGSSATSRGATSRRPESVYPCGRWARATGGTSGRRRNTGGRRRGHRRPSGSGCRRRCCRSCRT